MQQLFESVGAQLEQSRMERGWTIDECSERLAIPRGIVEQLEQGGCEVPADAYRRQQLKTYAQALGLPWQGLWKQLVEEKSFCVHQARLPIDPQASSLWRHRPRGRWAIVAGAVCLALLYLGSQLLPTLTPPVLVVEQPYDQEIIVDSTTVVRGHATVESQVTINGKNVAYKSLDGSFFDTLSLQPGLNTIVVTATKKNARRTSIERHVYVRQDRHPFTQRSAVPIP